VIVKLLRQLVTPGGLAALVVVVSVVVLERSGAGIGAGLGGALVGWLAILAAGQVGLLAAVPLAGMRAHRVVLGIGPRVADWSGPNRTLILRLLPIVLAVNVRAARAPVRRRMWWSAFCSAVAELAVVVLAAMWAQDGGAFAAGFAIACVAEFVYGLLPKRTAMVTSTGWLLFRLPWVDTEQARELEAAPIVGEAIEAAQRGDLATAERLAAGLRETYPDLRSALAARVFVLEAQGRYAEAMILAVKVAGDARQQPDEAASSFAALAGLACATVEAGQLNADLGLSTANTALENAATLGYPAYKLNGVRALHALLRGEVDEAVALASRAAEAGDSVLVRADDLATLARAHMASGDNQAARAAISEAEKLASWWPRVAGTRSRLEVS
jgi:tetratricopeptide (TPR) repeat protein